jgi:hypothetical protein
MKSTIPFLIVVLLLTATSFSQETTPEKNTVDNQFKALYKNSNNYQEYKVVKKKEYGLLHTNVLDSLKQFNVQLKSKATLIHSQKAIIEALEKDNKETQTKLTTAINKENSIALLGIQLSKDAYSLILFITIWFLIVILAIFIYKFKNNNVITNKAKISLDNLENEFNFFRKKSLERQQKLRRELQDEILKNRNN